MWRRRLNRKGQSTGEYALVFAIILGAIIAMQTYVKRSMQGRVKSGTDYMASETQGGEGFLFGGLDSVNQYDPYYYTSKYKVSRDSKIEEDYDSGGKSFTDVQQDDTKRFETGFTKYGEAEDQPEEE